MRDDFFDGQVAVGIVVVQYAAREGKMAVLAIEHVVERHHSIVERAGNHDDLERRARLDQVGNDAIAPGIGVRTEIIRIVGRQRRHREDLACARTNHEPRNTDRRMLLHAFHERRLEDVLQNGINREHNIPAVARLDVLIPERHQLAIRLVRFGHAPATDTSEVGVEGGLNAVLAGSLRHLHAVDFPFALAHVAEHMRGQRLIRINTLLIVQPFGEYALRPQVSKELLWRLRRFACLVGQCEPAHDLPDFFPSFDRHFLLQTNVRVGGGLAFLVLTEAREQSVVKFVLIHAEQRRHGSRDLGLIIPQQRRIGADGLHEDAGGKQISPRVENVSPAWLAQDFALALPDRLRAEYVMAEDLQVHQPIAQPGKGGSQQENQE